jgi:hypothetical protein
MTDSTTLQARMNKLEVSYADARTSINKHKRAHADRAAAARKKARTVHELNRDRNKFLEAHID